MFRKQVKLKCSSVLVTIFFSALALPSLSENLSEKSLSTRSETSSHKGFCEQMGGKEITNLSEVKTSSGLTDLVACEGIDFNNPIFKARTHNLSLGAIKGDEKKLKALSPEEVESINSIQTNNSKNESIPSINEFIPSIGTLTSYVCTGSAEFGTNFTCFGGLEWKSLSPVPNR